MRSMVEGASAVPLASSCPAKRGRGPCEAWWKGLRHQRWHKLPDKPPRCTPPPPRKCAVPLPRCAGADERQHSRGAPSRPSHANHYAQEKRPREAKRRKAHAIHCPRFRKQVYAVCATRPLRGRAPNGARSPSGASPRTCHASRNQHWLSPRPCFLGPGSRGYHPPSPVPVQRAPRRPVVLPDERCPGPPGSGVQIRARAPHPAPLPGLPRESDPRMSGIFSH